MLIGSEMKLNIGHSARQSRPMSSDYQISSLPSRHAVLVLWLLHAIDPTVRTQNLGAPVRGASPQMTRCAVNVSIHLDTLT